MSWENTSASADVSQPTDEHEQTQKNRQRISSMNKYVTKKGREKVVMIWKRKVQQSSKYLEFIVTLN